MTPQQVVEKFIYDKLVAASAVTGAIAAGPGGAGKGIHRDRVEQSYSFPAVVFQMLAGEDWNTQMSSRGAVDFRYLVKVVGEGNKATIFSIVENVDLALHEAQLVVSGQYQVDSMRVRPVDVPEVVDGKIRHQVGGVYQIIWRPEN